MIKLLASIFMKAKVPLDSRSSVTSTDTINFTYDGLLTWDKTKKKFRKYMNGFGFLDLFPFPINVMDYGADETGVLDSTLAFKNALLDANNRKLYIPSGTFKLTDKLSINSTTKIVGAGKQISILYCVGCDGIEINADSVDISGITLRTDSTTKGGIVVKGNYVNIFDNRLDGADENTKGWSCNIRFINSWNSNVYNCDIKGGAEHVTQNGYGIISDYSVNCKIYGNNFNSLNVGLYISALTDSVTGHMSEGWSITNNLFIVSNFGIVVDKGNWVDIGDNIIDMIYKVGINFSIDGGGSIHDNWIAQYNLTSSNTDNTYISILMNKGSRASISNNVINVLASTDISVKLNTSYSNFHNNHIFQGKTGVQINGSNNILGGNIVTLTTIHSIDLESDYNIVQNNIGFGTIYTNPIYTHNEIGYNL